MGSEELKPKVKMPMIPLRDVVIFPNTVSTLFVGREKSIFSLSNKSFEIQNKWFKKLQEKSAAK